jgi:hypothetical protein
MALSNASGVNTLMDNFYGQTQNRDGSWNGVTIDNQAPINVDGYLPKKSVSVRRKAPEQLQQVDSGRQASRAPYNNETGVIEPDPNAGKGAEGAGKAARSTAQVLTAQNDAYQKGQMAVAAVGFVVDVMNANNAYENAKGQAQINIMLARNSANDAIYRGHQAALDRQSEGFNAGNDAALAMAAQGQDVRGQATQKLVGSYNAVGYENAAREEMNSIREAMGYQLEEVQYEYQGRMAGINRDVAIWGAGLNAAAQIGASAAMMGV